MKMFAALRESPLVCPEELAKADMRPFRRHSGYDPEATNRRPILLCCTTPFRSIADDPCVWVEKIGADGRAVRVLDHENLARARLRIKALQRQAARMAPRKCGNRR